MQQFQSELPAFEEAGAQVIGVSADPHFSQDAWCRQIDVTFPHISDLDGEISDSYDASMEGLAGYRGATAYATFVIDTDGTVEYAWVGEEPGDAPDVDAALEAVRSL